MVIRKDTNPGRIQRAINLKLMLQNVLETFRNKFSAEGKIKYSSVMVKSNNTFRGMQLILSLSGK